MATSPSLKNPNTQPQLGELDRLPNRLIKRFAHKTIALLGVTTILMCQVPVGQAQQQTSQLLKATALSDRIYLARLVTRGIDKLRRGDYSGAIADFRQVSNTIPKPESTAAVFGSYEQIATRRRTAYQQAITTTSSQQELRKFKTLLLLGHIAAGK